LTRKNAVAEYVMMGLFLVYVTVPFFIMVGFVYLVVALGL
jgi:hypothetical protein